MLMCLQSCLVRLFRFIRIAGLCFVGVAVAQTQAEAKPPANSSAADFENLARYASADAATAPSSKHGHRVVFLGDSITDYWGKKAGTWFSSPEWINRGITGQTTGQILLREQADAVALHPDAIVIEGGSNDMRYGFTPETIRDHVASMGEIAEANHMKVFIALMTPVCDCFRQLSAGRTPENIRQLNALYTNLCQAHGWVCIDTFSPLADSQGLMRKDLTLDGVHPNDTGYALLAPVYLQSLKAFR